MVRLKVYDMLNRIAVSGFQFHYGTIKSATADDQARGLLLFQFHYGTIKRIGKKKDSEI